MSSKRVARRMVLGLVAATFGGLAASASAIHLRPPVAFKTASASATTFTCSHLQENSYPASSISAAIFRRLRTSVCGHSGRSYRVTVANPAGAGTGAVVAVVVPVPGAPNSFSVKVLKSPRHAKRGAAPFVSTGTVSFNGVQVCSTACGTKTRKTSSNGRITVVAVPVSPGN